MSPWIYLKWSVGINAYFFFPMFMYSILEAIERWKTYFIVYESISWHFCYWLHSSRDLPHSLAHMWYYICPVLVSLGAIFFLTACLATLACLCRYLRKLEIWAYEYVLFKVLLRSTQRNVRKDLRGLWESAPCNDAQGVPGMKS